MDKTSRTSFTQNQVPKGPCRVKCCCFLNAKVGLRILGFYWLFMCLALLSVAWMPVIWLYCIIQLLSLAPPLFDFISMFRHNDDVDSRHRLYLSYKRFAVYFGLPGHVVAYFYLQFHRCDFATFLHEKFGFFQNRTCGDPNDILIVLEGLISLAMLSFFRIYFMKVMKQYEEDGAAQTNRASYSFMSHSTARKNSSKSPSRTGSVVSKEPTPIAVVAPSQDTMPEGEPMNKSA